MYSAEQPLSLGQLPSGIPAEVGQVVAGSAQLPAGYYSQLPQQYGPTRSVTSAHLYHQAECVGTTENRHKIGITLHVSVRIITERCWKCKGLVPVIGNGLF